MLVSEEKRFLFVHVQKTAGTSITHFLREAVPDIKDYLRPHDPIRLAEKDLNGKYKEFYKVAFVRNPFDRLVSWYAMISASGKLLSEEEMQANPGHNKIWQHVLSHSQNFSEFIINCSDATDKSGWKPFLYNQIDYLVDVQDNCMVDFIGQFENIEADFQQICRHLEIDGKSFPKINASKHYHYHDYYNSETRKIVADRFSKDIEFFKYKY